ncbi:hypothetical protein GKQ38_03490 [Candidatus Nanohaloarchaea archaeon]|nr:hypothetical protein GKQ38_03490 [Candidatus Nanohaloarchaea archaeon]
MGESFHELEPDQYDELNSMQQGRSLVVFDADRRRGVVEISYGWDDLDYTLDLSEEYADSSHLDALDHISENYDDEDLPENIRVEDVENVSSAFSSDKIGVNWQDVIEVGGTASELDY